MAQTGLVRLGCRSCRCSILNSFISLAPVSIPPPPPLRLPTILQQCRLVSQTARRTNEQPNQQPDVEAEGRYEEIKATETGTPPAELAEAQSQPQSSLPWYLQAQDNATPAGSANPLSDKQKRPDLPKDPPPVLSPILDHLFESAGLDDLALVDLRKLDPPPALGANLIMIIGTARSIKHLNVSADRFCRWLRTEHKLRPFADGLLGRNELKIKLRRRAKRAKMASSVGKQIDDTNRDDGITTGWVCVQVGTVPGHEGAVTEPEVAIEAEGTGFVGFGTKSLGPSIVVQMLTEEKRAELDLEGLWEYRQGRRASKELASLDEAGSLEELEAEVIEKVAKTFDDAQPKNDMADMNPAPEELRNFQPFQ